MKKTISNLLVIGFLLVMVGCSQTPKPANMSVYEGFPETHRFLEANPKTMIKNLEGMRDGIYYIAYSDNPTSYNFAEILDTISKEKTLDIHTLDLTRNELSIQQNEKLQEIAQKTQQHETMVYPVVYVVYKDTISAVTPVFDGVSITNRTLTASEVETVTQEINQLIDE